MKLVIDMQGLQTMSRFRGIGRYTLSITEAIIKNKGSHEIFLLLMDYNKEVIDSIYNKFSKILPSENILICSVPSPIYASDKSNQWRCYAAEIIREYYLAEINPDFLLITSLFEGFGENFVCSIKKYLQIPTAVIFYDVIPLLNPETYLQDVNTKSWYQNKIEECLKADLLLSISESAKKEAIRYLNFTHDNVVNISAASDGKFCKKYYSNQEKYTLKAKFNLKDSFILYTGASDDRKNHLRLIQAYSLLPTEIKKTTQLVIAGGLEESHKVKFLNKAKECSLSKNDLIITGRITDDEMNLLYILSTVFVFPSWHEGFGLPALEAMHCGKAVIGSNISSIPEVIGNSKALFNPFNIKDMSKKIELVLTNEKFRASLEEHAIQQIKKFSWEKTAKTALFYMEKKVIEIKSNNIKKYKFFDIYDKVAKIPLKATENDLCLVSKSIYKNFISK